VPVGSVSVRVVRGGFDKSLAGQTVEFTVDGRKESKTTDESGRAVISGLKPGARVKAVAVVDGERLESQDITIETSGLSVALVATDPDATKREAADARLAAGPAVTGTVVFGPESRVIAEFTDDRLTIFYLLDIVNTARTPVDIGGPIAMSLPREARGAAVVQGSSTQATVKGAHLTVTGPFAPGKTSVQVAFELPTSGGAARLEQVWPATLQALTVMVQQIGDVDIASPQITTKQAGAAGGPAVITGIGPAIPAGQSLRLDISGLPHHPVWPRNIALALSLVIMAAGLWAAVFPASRRRTG
jgi:hypothetical protein